MENEEVKKKHPRKNPTPQKCFPSQQTYFCPLVEIKIEPPDVPDASAEEECKGTPLFLPVVESGDKRSGRRRHRRSHSKKGHLSNKERGGDLSFSKSKCKTKRENSKRRDKTKVKQKELTCERSRKRKDKNMKTGSKTNHSSECNENVVQKYDSVLKSHMESNSDGMGDMAEDKEKSEYHKKKLTERQDSHRKHRNKHRSLGSHTKTKERSVRYPVAKKRKLDKGFVESSPIKLKVELDPVDLDSLQHVEKGNVCCQGNTSQDKGAERNSVVGNASNACIRDTDGSMSAKTDFMQSECDLTLKCPEQSGGELARLQLEKPAELMEQKSAKHSNNSDLNTLTENLLSLNRDSAHLNTVIHQKPTPRKKRAHLKHGNLHSQVKPLKSLTPHKSPWKTISMRFTPHKHSTPSASSCQTPKSTPGSTSGSITDLNTPESTPCSAKSEKKYRIPKRTPSKISIKRRLYAAMKSPEKIIDENEDVANLSFPDLTSTEFDGIQQHMLQESPEKSKYSSPPKVSSASSAVSPLKCLPPPKASSPEKESSPPKRSLSAKKSLPFKKRIFSIRDTEDDRMSSCSEELNIVSDPDDDPLDAILEEKSKRVQHVQLTAKNVRSIIHQVITNEHVLDMVRNTLEEDGLGDQLKEAIFEPRLTRSMVKEAIQKGTIPLPWSFPPIQVLSEDKSKAGPQFLEMTFSDSEDNDEEYMPSPEELEHAEDDEASICSQTSDFGSPFPSCLSVVSSCMSTPEVTSEKDKERTTQSAHSETVSSMGPPSVTQIPGSKQAKNHTEMIQRTEEEMMIAKRTRSKLPLTDTPLEVIESEFVAPDITPDMYDTQCVDTEWQEFLAGLMKSQDLNDTCDEAEDPEYNFLTDNEKDNADDEDFRNDRAVNIPKKEVDELMSELFEAYSGSFFGDESPQEFVDEATFAPNAGHSPMRYDLDQTMPSSPDELGDNCQSTCSSGYPGRLPPLELNPHMASIVASDIMRIKHNTLEIRTSVPKLTDLEVIQLQDQMRKHVQLLAQTYVQCAASDNDMLKNIQKSAKNLLIELKLFGDAAEKNTDCSYMKPPNLEEAIEITKLDIKSDNPEAEELLAKNLNTISAKKLSEYPLTYKQMDVLVSSPVFLFPQMMPDYALVANSSCKKRVAFTHAEDNLLAMGFDQFHHLEQRYLYIHKFLLPTKQRKQIRFRHKNLRSRYNGEAKCALNYWYEKGHLPEFQRYLEVEDVADIKAPKYRDPELLPAWYQAYLSTKQQIEPPHEEDADLSKTGSRNTAAVSDSGSSSLKNFKREPQRNFTSRKPAVAKPSSGRLQPIAAKLPNVNVEKGMSNIIVNMTTEPCLQSQEADIGQQVLDSLMTVISDDSAVNGINTVVTHAAPVAPIVAVAKTNEQAQPVVMLTTSQLEQLGIKVNVIEPVETSPGAGLDSPNVTEQSNHSFDQAASVTGAQSEAELAVKISSQSVISHAFSQATGICPDHLGEATETNVGGSSAGEVLPPVMKPKPACTDSHFEQEKSNITENNTNMANDNLSDNVNCQSNNDTSRHENGDASNLDVKNEAPNAADSGVEENSMQQCKEEICNEKGSPQAVTTNKEAVAQNNVCTETSDMDLAEQHNEKNNELRSDANRNSSVFLQDELSREKEVSLEETNEQKDLDFESVEDGDVDVSKNSSSVSGISTSNTTDSDADSPVKNTMRVMAELVQLISPAPRISPLKLPHQHRLSFSTPQKRSPKKSPLKPLRPLGSITSSPVKLNLPKRSVMGRPRRYSASHHRKRFNKQAQSIAPKGFIVQSYVSPVKLAAASIAAKARKKKGPKPKVVRSLRALLPKAGKQSNDDISADFSIIDDQADDAGFHGCGKQLGRSVKTDFDLDGFAETEAGNESQPEEEQLDEEMEEEMDRDEDQLAQLMAASTTVRSATKTSLTGEQKRKKIHKRAALLQLLEPDLVDNDPRRDERDTAFAQGYLVKVQQALSSEPEQYEKFLKLLYEFGCSDKTPVELYFSMKELLKDNPSLLSDFAAFLMPDQAKVCGCLMDHINFSRCREFLRKLEIHFSKQPHTLQRVIKAFSQWQNSSQSDPTDLMATVKPLLKGQPYLLDEFTKFFDNVKPPESYRTEFEEVDLADSNDEQPEFDGYEEVQFPDGDDDDELFGTKLCRCKCHENSDMKYAKRRVHCRSCAVRVVRGHVYLQSSERDLFLLQPSTVHHSPNCPVEAEGIPSIPTGDGELIETLQPPAVDSKHKTSNKKLKVKIQSVKKPCSSDKTFATDANSVDGFGDRGDTLSEDDKKQDDYSQSVSPRVLSCGEEAILSPDGASSGQVTGPTDFSHMRKEFSKRSCSSEMDAMESDCIMKASPSDVIALSIKMEDDQNPSLHCENAVETDNIYGLAGISNYDTDVVDQVKSENEDDNTASVSNDLKASTADGGTGEIPGSEQNHDVSGDQSSDDTDPESQDSSIEWSREDDRLILETCRREGTGSEVFQTLSATLCRTSDQIAQRFIMMINLLAEDEEGTERSDGEGEE